MPSSVRKRSACDRCHAQKLRCSKQPGYLVCDRCRTARAKCVYSPPGTSLSGTIRSTSPWPVPETAVGTVAADPYTYGQDASHHLDTTAFDWTLDTQGNYDFNSFLLPLASSPVVNGTAGEADGDNNASALASSSCEPSRFNSATSPRNTNIHQIACLQNLTKILLEADDLLSRLPLQTTLHVQQTDSHIGLLKRLPETMPTNTTMERFFGLAQRLIDAYPAALDASLPKKSPPDATCDITDCTHTLDLPASLLKLESEVVAEISSATPDVSLVNLVVSCHTRLLDILDRFFLMVTACTRVTLASGQEPEFDLSELHVGSFVPQRPAAVLMQITLLERLVAGLANRVLLMGDAISVFAERDDEDSDEVVILQSQHKLLANRQITKSRQVKTVEDFLKQFNF